VKRQFCVADGRLEVGANKVGALYE
jgi:hypothetical protein